MIRSFSLSEVFTMLSNGQSSAHAVQRQRVLTQSIFGIWHDEENMIELKLSPLVGGAKIKVWTVNDLSVIQKISSFCGLDSNPKRAQWQGFDLVSNMEKSADDSFINGVVNMPNSKRKNCADFRVAGNTAYLDFFYYEICQKSITQNKSGSLILALKR